MSYFSEDDDDNSFEYLSESEDEKDDDQFQDPYYPYNNIIECVYKKVMNNYENKLYDDVIYDDDLEYTIFEDEGYESG